MRFSADYKKFNEIKDLAASFYKKSQQIALPGTRDVSVARSWEELASPKRDEVGPYWGCEDCDAKVRYEDLGDVKHFIERAEAELVPGEKELTTEDVNKLKEAYSQAISKIEDNLTVNKIDFDSWGINQYLQRINLYVLDNHLNSPTILLQNILYPFRNSINAAEKLNDYYLYLKTGYRREILNSPLIDVINNKYEHTNAIEDEEKQEIIDKIVKPEFEKIKTTINNLIHDLTALVGTREYQRINVIKKYPLCPSCYEEQKTTCDQDGCKFESIDDGDFVTVEKRDWVDGKTIKKTLELCKQEHGADCGICSRGIDLSDDEYMDYDNERYHNDCFWDHYSTCEECNEIFDRDHMNYDEESGNVYCEECFDQIRAERQEEEEDSEEEAPDRNEAKKAINSVLTNQGILYPLDASIISGNILPVLNSALKKFQNSDDKDKIKQFVLPKIQKADAKSAVENDLENNDLASSIRNFEANLNYQKDMKEKYPNLKGYRPVSVEVKVNGGEGHKGLVFAIYPSEEMLSWADKILPGASKFYKDVIRDMGHHSGALGYVRLTQSNGKLIIDNLQTDVDKQANAFIYKKNLFTRDLQILEEKVKFEEAQGYTGPNENKELQAYKNKIIQDKIELENFDKYVAFWSNTIDKFYAPYLLDLVARYAKRVDMPVYLTSFEMQNKKWNGRVPDRNKDVYDRLPENMGKQDEEVEVRPEDLDKGVYKMKRIANLEYLADKFFKLSKIRSVETKEEDKESPNFGKRINDPAGFSLNKFEALGPKEAFKYARDNLKEVSYGSSRVVFLLTSRKVLKIAWNPAGYAQNNKEKELSDKYGDSGLLTKVYAGDPSGMWIISELVDPISSEAQFESLTGVTEQDLKTYIDIDPEEYEELQFELEMQDFSPKAIDFLLKATEFGKKTNLIDGDFSKYSSWGRAADGRIVLLDYGADRELFDSYYKKTTPNEDKTRKTE